MQFWSLRSHSWLALRDCRWPDSAGTGKLDYKIECLSGITYKAGIVSGGPGRSFSAATSAPHSGACAQPYSMSSNMVQLCRQPQGPPSLSVSHVRRGYEWELLGRDNPLRAPRAGLCFLQEPNLPVEEQPHNHLAGLQSCLRVMLRGAPSPASTQCAFSSGTFLTILYGVLFSHLNQIRNRLAARAQGIPHQRIQGT